MEKNNDIKEKLIQRLTNLILEDEVFISRLNKFSNIGNEILKRLENNVKSLVERFFEKNDPEKVDEDEAYILLASDIKNLKIQTINDLKNKRI